MNEPLRARQVHLDFHTTEKIEGVATKFNKKEFQDNIKLAEINSITIFGKCHHGFCYYPTKVGTMNPSMPQDMDLAAEMMDACHEIGVRAPLYITLGWSAYDAETHPEWVVRDIDGNKCGSKIVDTPTSDDPKPECSWWHLCYLGGYSQHLYDITHEVCSRYKVLDGLFYDIVFNYELCYCDDCKKGMTEQGYDYNDVTQVSEYHMKTKHEVLNNINKIIESYHPDATIFYNSGGADIHMPQWQYLSTHYEMEDLPTTWGGYDKMPIRAKYFGAKGKDFLGMTGKFHRSWGEFGGFKPVDALKYECAALLAWGARISIGDQLHPLGFVDNSTYKNIGYAYSYVKQIEDYCFDVSETAKLGVIIDIDPDHYNSIAKLLLDCHIDFDIVHNPDDVKKFDTIIIASETITDDAWIKSINAYIKNEGKIIFMGANALNADKNSFALDLPFEYISCGDFDKDYLEVCDIASENMVTSPLLCYSSAHKIKGEGQVLAKVRLPYFSRTYNNYCSHANTPYSTEAAAHPAAIRNGNIIYIAHDITSDYIKFGNAYHRTYFYNLLSMLYTNKNVDVKLPVSARVRFVDQASKERYVLHLLYPNPVMRGSVEVLEDFPTLYNTTVNVVCERPIKKVYSVPDNKEYTFTQDGNKLTICVPEFSMHKVVVFEY